MTWVQKAGSAKEAYEQARKLDPEAQLKVSKVGQDRYLVETTYGKTTPIHTRTEAVTNKAAASSYQQRYPETSLSPGTQSASKSTPQGAAAPGDLPPDQARAEEQKVVQEGKVTMSPAEAYEAGLISQREREHGERGNLVYETTPENLGLARQAKSELYRLYPDVVISPGATPSEKLYYLETQRGQIAQNIAANPVVRASYVFDRDILGFGTVSELAVSALTGQDWNQKREQMMISYSEELMGRDDAVMAGTIAAVKTGVVVGAVAATGGAAGAKVAAVSSTAMKVSYGVVLGTQYGETIKVIQDPTATGVERAEAVARSFIYTTPLMVQAATKVTRPVAQKVLAREPKMLRGMAGSGRKTGSRQQTKTQTKQEAAKSKADAKKAYQRQKTIEALREGRAKIIKVQTKQGFKQRVVWNKKTGNEKALDRLFRKMAKDHKAQKATKNVRLVDQETYDFMKQKGFIDQKGQWTVKGKAAAKVYEISQKVRLGQDYRIQPQGGPRRAAPPPKAPEKQPGFMQSGRKSGISGKRSWWEDQKIGRQRILEKQKVSRTEYQARLDQAKADAKLKKLTETDLSKDLRAVALGDLLDSKVLSRNQYQLAEKPDVREKEDQAAVILYGLDQDTSQMQDQQQLQDLLQQQSQATAQALDEALRGGGGRGGGGGSPGPAAPRPPPPPSPPGIPDEIIRGGRPRPPEQIPQETPPEIPGILKLPWIEDLPGSQRGQVEKIIKEFNLKHFYTASLAGSMRLVPPVKEPGPLAKKGFGIRPLLQEWFPQEYRKKRSKKRRKR